MVRTIIATGITLLLHLSSYDGASAVNLRGRSRAVEGPYYTLTSSALGSPNPDAAIGNPLKGLMESPRYTQPPYEASIPVALEFYYIGLDEVMKGNPNIVGESAAFNWTVVDEMLNDSASRRMHAVLRFIVHFPGKPMMMPKYLIDAGAEIRWYDGGASPYYGDPKLLEAFQQFLTRFGKRYDGNKRIGFIQAGLLGFWGEWHTWGSDFIPPETEEKVVEWYKSAFTKTQIQVRYPKPSAFAAGFGLHDDSFAYNTLDGEANGGVIKPYYFWPKVVSLGQSDIWKKAAIGGETRGELQNEVFEPSYPARTFQKQDFMECVNTTHATFMFHHYAFKDGGYTGTELKNARRAHARMGYNFHVPSILVRNSTLTSNQVDIEVTVTQVGVAPFYYDLGLTLRCPVMPKKYVGGVNSLLARGDSKVLTFTGVPADQACLSALSLALESSYAYQDRPIAFAQKNGTISFSVPVPGEPFDPPTEPRNSPWQRFQSFLGAILQKLFPR